jgi:hypothetical protein
VPKQEEKLIVVEPIAVEEAEKMKEINSLETELEEEEEKDVYRVEISR